MTAPPLPANLYFWQGLRWATGGLVVLGLPALFFLPYSVPLALACWVAILALWWFLYRRADRHYVRHYVVAAALMAAMAPLPALGLGDDKGTLVLVWIGLVGLLFPTLGLLDHRELAHRTA